MNCDVTITYPSTTVNYQYVPKHMKRITRTIDRYDKDGKLIEREVIVEEHEDVERMVYEQPSYPYCPPPYQPPWYDYGTWVTCNPNGYASSGNSLCIN
jgi:hypothetical protein